MPTAGSGGSRNPEGLQIGLRTAMLGALLVGACLSPSEARAGNITQIIEGGLVNPLGVAVDASQNVYVASNATDRVFKITSVGVVTELIDRTGDGAGNLLTAPEGVAVDASGNVYVVGTSGLNPFKITPGGVITELAEIPGCGGKIFSWFWRELGPGTVYMHWAEDQESSSGSCWNMAAAG